MEYDVKGNLREVLGHLPEGVRLCREDHRNENAYY